MSKRNSSSWRIELFGGIRAIRNTEVFPVPRIRKAADLLAYLAYHPKVAHPREALIEILWPDYEDLEAGRRNLNQAVHTLRQLLEPNSDLEGTVIISDRFCLYLNPDAYETDVEQFERLAKEANQATQIEDKSRLLTGLTNDELYREGLLPGLYQDWVMIEQGRLEEVYIEGLSQLIVSYHKEQNYSHALRLTQKWLKAVPLEQKAHRTLLGLHSVMGNTVAAMAHIGEMQKLFAEHGEVLTSSSQKLIATVKTNRDRIDAQKEISIEINERPATPLTVRSSELEPLSGAVPISSVYYIERNPDSEYLAAIRRKDGIVRVKGALQSGKTSLLVRGLHTARQERATVLLTNYEVFNATQYATPETFLLALAESLSEQLDLAASPLDDWLSHRGANMNFRRFLRRHILTLETKQIVWGMDAVDRLVPLPYADEIFSLFRSWHDDRERSPEQGWSKLTLAIAHSTEPSLFINDPRQSPFNVGISVQTDDFDIEQVRELNRLYLTPIRNEEELVAIFAFLGGHPFLTQRAFYEMSHRNLKFQDLEAVASQEDNIFRDHLARMLANLRRRPELQQPLMQMLTGSPCPDRDSFYRLRSAGFIKGASPQDAQIRCSLYTQFLKLNLSS